MTPKPALIICMGVSGCGKSTVAIGLAKRFGLRFIEADNFHPPENQAHMAAGKPLTDAMREPWIDRLCRELSRIAGSGENVAMAYSGLRRAHRQRFRELGFRTLFLHLQSDSETIAQRLEARAGHYMPPTLLDSQFAAMEAASNEPDLLAVDCGGAEEEVLESCARLAREFLWREGEPPDLIT